MKFLEKVKYIKEFNKKRFIYEGIYCFIEYLEYILVGCLYLKWIVTDVQSGNFKKNTWLYGNSVFNLHYQKLYK